MDVKIIKGTEENLKIAKNLVHYYIYDMGVPMDWDCREDGVFDGCDEMSENWTSENYFSYLIYNGKYPIGFAIVKSFCNSEVDYEIEEFFILRKYRNKNIGKKIAFELFDKYRGKWQIKILLKNTPAQDFWRKVIEQYSNNTLQESQIVHKCPYSGDWEMIRLCFDN